MSWSVEVDRPYMTGAYAYARYDGFDGVTTSSSASCTVIAGEPVVTERGSSTVTDTSWLPVVVGPLKPA